jgi:dUTP pyrophosphatase
MAVTVPAPGWNEVEVRILPDSEEFVPKYQTEGSADCDLVANVPKNSVGEKEVVILPGRCVMIDCGFRMAVPPGWKAEASMRSGHAKALMIMPNSPAQLDSDFRGRPAILVANVGKNPMCIKDRDRFAQMWVAPAWRIKWNVVTELEETARGSGGFGSTGKQ